MNNENNVNYVPTETETTLSLDTKGVTGTKVLKRQPGLGRLNRAIKATQELVSANGHANKRFKRDYTTGTASYTCPNCNASVTIKLESARGQVSVQGDGLTLKCSVINS